MNLAIKGHPTRGNEVIELLEMLGGVDWHGFAGNRLDSVYYISESIAISCDNTYDIVFEDGIKEFITFTLEEFLGKYPYKVGNEVIYRNNIFCIKSSQWDSEKNTVIYYIDADWSAGYVVETNDLQPYKEESMKTITIDDFKANTKEWLIDKLHDMIISDAIKTIGDIHDELHKPQYPKDYYECCKILDLNSHLVLGSMPNLYKNLIVLQKLLICRNAYWKIAGEEMRLGKPWEQNYCDRCFIIANNKGNIYTYEYHGDYNIILAFPTAEMRDAFYENFKDLIEECKELL